MSFRPCRETLLDSESSVLVDVGLVEQHRVSYGRWERIEDTRFAFNCLFVDCTNTCLSRSIYNLVIHVNNNVSRRHSIDVIKQ